MTTEQVMTPLTGIERVRFANWQTSQADIKRRPGRDLAQV
jgi:hypothetical protein